MMRRNVKKLTAGMMMVAMLALTACGAGAEQETEDTTTEAATEAEATTEAEVTLTLPEELTLTVGEETELEVTTDYEGTLNYRSTNDTILTVDESGMITAIKGGEAKVEVIAGTVRKRVTITVAEAATEEETEAEETTEEDTDTQTAVAVGTGSATSGSTSSSTTTSGSTTTSDSTTGGSTSDSAATTEAVTEATGLDWYWIADEVNRQLKAAYPNCTIGKTESYTHSDDAEEVGQTFWTNQSMADDIFNGMVTEMNMNSVRPSDTTATMGMFIDYVGEIGADGWRDVEYTCYR